MIASAEAQELEDLVRMSASPKARLNFHRARRYLSLVRIMLSFSRTSLPMAFAFPPLSSYVKYLRSLMFRFTTSPLMDFLL